jgi:hypothetical protein
VDGMGMVTLVAAKALSTPAERSPATTPRASAAERLFLGLLMHPDCLTAMTRHHAHAPAARGHERRTNYSAGGPSG